MRAFFPHCTTNLFMHAENKKNIAPKKLLYFLFHPKRVDNFLVSLQTRYEYSFEASQRGDSSEDPQHTFSLKAPYSSKVDILLSNNGLIN